MQGIVGGTYDRYLEGEAAVSKPEDQLYIPDDVRPLILPHIVHLPSDQPGRSLGCSLYQTVLCKTH